MHGTHETVNRICDHPDIQAISFVGSNAAGQYIYERGSRSGKRIQVPLPVCGILDVYCLAIHVACPGDVLSENAVLRMGCASL